MPIEHIAVLRGDQEGSSGEDDPKETLEIVETHYLESWGDAGTLNAVGNSISRPEGMEKVTGRARYAYDMRLPGQLYVAALRSPYPHAQIKHIDVSKAESLEGVHAVLSSANAPDITWYEEECPLFSSTVRFVGDEVAVVAAETEEIAQDALYLIEVEYDPLPFVTNIAEALAPDAPEIHEGGNQAGDKNEYSRGDVEEGFAKADVIIEQIYTTPTQVHNSLEPHGCTAFWEGEQLTIWESTQGIFQVREEIAEKLGLPEHRVRVIKQHMGGGFGAKQVAWKQTLMASILSQRTRRPVQFMLDREAENLAAGNRGATVQQVRLGAKEDGTLTAISVNAKIASGAYRMGGEAANVSGTYQRLYACPNVQTEHVGIYINTGPSVAFRAPGHVEATFALESAMDELAQVLEMDPVQLRQLNYAGTDQKKELPYSSPDALRLCYERAMEVFEWPDNWSDRQPASSPKSSNESSKSSSGSKRRGIGIAAHEWGAAGMPPGYAWIKINSDGSVDVVTGTQDIGTGTRSGLLLIAAEELGMPADAFHVHLGDTAAGPYAPTSAGSATQPTVGPAVRAAAADAKRHLIKAAAKLLEEEDLTRIFIRDGVIGVRNEPDNTVTVKEVMGRLAPHMIQGHGVRGANPKGVSIRTFGVQCVEVEVDTETGDVNVLRVVAAHDCGRIVNPLMVESQVIGGVTQGIGYALTEERVVDAQSGIVLNANLEEYKVPTVADVPSIIYAGIDLPDPEANPTGAKGIGELPIIPTAPAIANAVFNAIGVRMRQIPLTRSRVLKALKNDE